MLCREFPAGKIPYPLCREVHGTLCAALPVTDVAEKLQAVNIDDRSLVARRLCRAEKA